MAAPLFLPSQRYAGATAHQPSGRVPATNWRLVTWAPRRPEVLPDAVRRQLDTLERAEALARTRGDLVALVTFDARIRHLLREVAA